MIHLIEAQYVEYFFTPIALSCVAFQENYFGNSKISIRLMPLDNQYNEAEEAERKIKAKVDEIAYKNISRESNRKSVPHHKKLN